MTASYDSISNDMFFAFLLLHTESDAANFNTNHPENRELSVVSK